jgi:uncharacterized protein
MNPTLLLKSPGGGHDARPRPRWRPLLLALPIALAILPAGCASPPPARQACVAETGSSVSVQGTASLDVKPDAVTFSVGVESRSGGVADAFHVNAKKVDSLLSALKEKGVTPGEIQTSYLDLSPLTSKGRPAGFKVVTLVTVRRKDVASAADLLEAALSAGANQVGGLSFYVSDRALFRQQGLELAFRDARSKAETLAGLAGRNLGRVVCVSDESRSSGNEDYSRLRSLGYVSGMTLEAGTSQIPFGVTVVFELQ